MRSPVNPWLDTASAALVHLIPLALVAAGRFDALDLVIVYAIEIALGLAVATARLVRRVGRIDWGESGWRRSGRIAGSIVALSVPAVPLGVFVFAWGETVFELIDYADWTVERVALAAFTGVVLAAYTWHRIRRSDTTGIGVGRVLLQMVVLASGITYGLRATEHLNGLRDAGWDLLEVADGSHHALASWIVQAIESFGAGPEAFAAIFIAAMMAFNEALLTAIRHIWNPPAREPEPTLAPTTGR